MASCETAERQLSISLISTSSVQIALHQEEADELPPLDDSAPRASWWRQLLAQIIGIGLNLAQAYFLQYLPARRRDLADERAMPRGPMF